MLLREISLSVSQHDGIKESIFQGQRLLPRRPTIHDVARAASVSVATVDRVLNQRQPVREGTATRVVVAAESLGYHATLLLQKRLQGELPQRTLGFLLQKRSDSFYQELAEALVTATRQAPGIRGRAVVEFMEDLSPPTTVAALTALAQRACAVAVVCGDHPNVSEAISRLRARGVPVCTLLSDLTAPSRAGYVGLDGRKAGRTAAWMIARIAQPGAVGLVVGSHRYLGHELCEIGFRAYFREHAAEFQVLETQVNLEEPRIAYEATLEMLSRHPGLTGLYIAGGGLEGVIQALRDEGAGGRVTLVCNELAPGTRAALIDGIVAVSIATPLPLVAARAVEMMAQALQEQRPEPAHVFLPFEMYVSENL